MVGRLALVALLFSFTTAFANGTADHESQRLTELNKAKNMGQAMDFMTPEEIAQEMGITDPEAQDPAIQEELFTPANDGGYEVRINVSIAAQRLTVSYPSGDWTTKISSGRKGYGTKRGCHSIKWMAKMHYSKKYDNSPMPHSLFYYGGFAIHGTQYEKNLGRPASHGCVRVSRHAARELFQIVRFYGAKNTLICVH